MTGERYGRQCGWILPIKGMRDMKCKKCGFNNPKGARYCGNCQCDLSVKIREKGENKGTVSVKIFFVFFFCIILWVLLAIFFVPEDGWHNRNGEYVYYRNGKKLEGLQEIDGNGYYFNNSGVMQTGWRKVNGRTFYFDDDGKMETGLQVIDNDLYYFTANGEVATGWMTIGGDTYHFQSNGKAVTGLQDISGYFYYFSSSGEMLTGLQKVGNSVYYFGKDGKRRIGLQKIYGATYYFSENGEMLTGFQKLGNSTYYFSENGQMLYGLQKVGNSIYYFGEDGKRRTGLQTINNETYYFSENGVMQTGEQKIGEGDLVGLFSSDGKLEYFIDNTIAQKSIYEQIYFEDKAGKKAHSYYKTLYMSVRDCSYLSISLEIIENKVGKGDGEWQVHLRELDGNWVRVGFFQVRNKKGIFEMHFEHPVSFDAFVCTRYSASESWSGTFKQNLSEIRYKSRGWSINSFVQN